MAVPPGNGAAAKSVPDVSSTKACAGSAIRNEESYASWCGGIGDPALAVRREEVDQDVERLLGAAGPLQPEAHQVHADEAGAAPARASCTVADTFVPDGHAELVDAVLGPPEPGGAGQEGGVGAGVTDREVLGAQGAAGRGTAAERHGELHLADGPVRILGEDHAARARPAQGVAHGCEHTEPELG